VKYHDHQNKEVHKTKKKMLSGTKCP